MKKIFIIILFTLLLIPMISSIPPVLQASKSIDGLELEIPFPNAIKENVGYEFNIHVLNSSTGTPMTSDTSCYFYLYNSTGHNQVELIDGEVDNTFRYSFFITGANFTKGEYPVLFQCNNSVQQGGFVEAGLTVNPSGTLLEEGSAIGYFTLMVFFVLIFSFCVIVFTNAEHIAIKSLGFFGGYAIAICMFYIGWIYSLNYMRVSIFIPKLFYWIFMILMIILPLLMLATIVYIIWLMITIAPIKRMMERGEVGDKAFEGNIGRDMRKLKRERDFKKFQ